MVDPVSFRHGSSLSIVPAGHDPRVHAALHVACQRVADDHHFAAVDRSDRVENLLEERRARLFRAERFRQKHAVHTSADAGPIELFRLRNDRAV